jgi:hypothetical protein
MITRRLVLGAFLLLFFVGFGIVSFGTVTSPQATATAPETAATAISGNYVEIRSCDVYTGPCFANGEMNLGGKDAIMSWSIREGSLDGVKLDGLNVIAVVEANNTLGNIASYPEPTRSVLVVDEAASEAQRKALVKFVQKKAGSVLGETVRVDYAPIVNDACAQCTNNGCTKLHAGNLVQIETRCLNGKDCVCGNEELFYPPLTAVADARPAYTTLASFQGTGLNSTFNDGNRRSAYLATFSN